MPESRMIEFWVSSYGRLLVKSSPSKSHPLGVLIGLAAIAFLWVSLARGVDPSQVFRQSIDSHMLVVEVIGVVLVVFLLLAGSRLRAFARRWRGSLSLSSRELESVHSSGESQEPLSSSQSLRVHLIAGPEPASPGWVAREALERGRLVQVIDGGRGGTLQEILGSRENHRLETLHAPIRESDLVAWMEAQSEPFTVVLVGVDCVRGWVLGERAETRLCRMIAALPELAVDGELCVIEPLSVDRVVRPDRFGARLLERLDRVWLWDAGERLEPASDTGSIGWYLVHGGGRRGLGAGGSRWRAWSMGLSTVVLMALAVQMVLWPTLSGSYGGTPLLGRMDDALPGSLWSNWWVAQWWAGENELLSSSTIFWPQGADLIPLMGNLGASFISIPLQQLGAYPEYWNGWVGACLMANGLATYWLARQVGADRGGALLGGLAMLLSAPVLVEVNGGHQSQFLMAGLPLCIGLSLRVLDLGSWWESWLLGLALVVTSLVWWVMGGVAWVILLALAAHRAWCHRHRRRELGSRLWMAFRIWVPSLLMAGPLIALANQDKLKGSGWGRLVHDSTSSQVEDLMLVNLFERSRAPVDLIMGPSTEALQLLAPLGLLFVVGFWWLRSRAKAQLWGWILGGSALAAMGPYLSPKAGFSQDWLVLPTGWIQALTPFATRFHQPDRLLIVSMLAIAVMISLIYRPLQQALPRRLRSLPLGLGVLAIFGLPWSQERLPIDVYDFDMPGWYDHLGDEGVMLEVPMGLSEVPAMFQPIHGRPVATGPGVVREMADADGYRSLVHSNPGINKLWEYDPVSKDASSLMGMRDDGLRYIVVNSRVIEHLIQTQGMDRARVMLLVSRWLDNTLGPPVLSAYQARVYRVPDEQQGALMLQARTGTAGPTGAPIEPEEADAESPAFEDIDEAFSPGYGEP